MAEFDESKHPRDDIGRFTKGGAKVWRQNTSYEEILRDDKENFAKYKTKQLQSIVFARISTYRKVLKKKGSAVFSVNDYCHEYTVRLMDENYNYEYEILKVDKIDDDEQ